MYSPLLFGPSAHSWFGGPAVPDLVAARSCPTPPRRSISVVPLSFRLTCYYYRGAYYKAFWADPAGCAVGEPRKKYLGERWFPLVIQNIHRYSLYLAIAFIVHSRHRRVEGDVVSRSAPMKLVAGAPTEFGIGVGTIVLTLNVVFIGCYTFGCHSLRHLVGGVLDVMSGQARSQDRLRLRELPEPVAHEVGVDQSDLGRLHGSLRADVRDGHLDGLQTVLRLNDVARLRA